MQTRTYLESLQAGLQHCLEQDPDVFLLGEDIAEPYGGAFKVTKHLSPQFPERVLQMPMSEQGFTGMAVGMAVSGLKPIVEIMFGDFLTLTADQVINHASKFVWLFQQPLHLVIRTPMGGYRGYGATHSQSLEKLFLGLPNITVVAPSVVQHPGNLLKAAVSLGTPVLFLEHKADYSRKMLEMTEKYELLTIRTSSEPFPLTEIVLQDAPDPDIALLTYGGMVQTALDIQLAVFLEEEISVKVLAVSQISPLAIQELIRPVQSMKYICVLEEGYLSFGWGDGVVSQLVQAGYAGRVKTFGAKPGVIGAAKCLEEYILPHINTIQHYILQQVVN